MGGQMWRRNDVIMKRRLSLTSFCGKTLCFVPPRRTLRMYQRQSRSYPETVNSLWFTLCQLSSIMLITMAIWKPDTSLFDCISPSKFAYFIFLIYVQSTNYLVFVFSKRLKKHRYRPEFFIRGICHISRTNNSAYLYLSLRTSVLDMW